MSVKLYMDVHIKRAVTDGLRVRGVDVLTAQEDDAAEFEDPLLLDRATELGRVLFSQDDDLLREANRRQQTGETFAGVIYAHQLNITVGQCINDLELIAKATEMRNGRIIPYICRLIEFNLTKPQKFMSSKNDDTKLFSINCDKTIFNETEIAILEKHGGAFQRLTEESRTPETPLQRHFVSVCKGAGKAVTPYEKLWLKYLRQLEHEAVAKNNSVNAEQDFNLYFLPKIGLVIFDKKIQSGLSKTNVRLWKVAARKPNIFDKIIFREKRLTLEQYEKNVGKTFNPKIDEAVAAYRKWRDNRRATHCFGCQKSLVDYSYNTRQNCGWIKCRCGFCGCDYKMISAKHF